MVAATGGEEEAFPSTPASPLSSASMNPENRLKFLCSYGGKIFPCPSDGHLKYVGGHTRVLSVSRAVSFSELKQRIEGMIDRGLAVVKYELEVDGLDGVLVSIGCDEDLAPMIDEYDRLELASPSARFRLFLFPSASSSSPPSKAAATVFSCPSLGSTSPSSTIDGAAALGPKGHCVLSTPNVKGGTFTRQLSLGAARAPHHQPQNHLLFRQRSAGASSYGSRAVPAGAFVCDSRVIAPQTASRGRFPHGGGGGGGCVSPSHASRRKYVFW